MKKLTKNNLGRYSKVINVGYAQLQSLLSHGDRKGYNSGSYGWNWNLFEIGDIAIITGYRNFPNFGVDINRDITKKYDNKAKGKTTEQKQKLLLEFIEEIEKL